MSHASSPLVSCMRSRLSWVRLHARLHSWQRERGQSSCGASRGWARSLASNGHLLLAWVQNCLLSLPLGTACSPWLLIRPQLSELSLSLGHPHPPSRPPPTFQPHLDTSTFQRPWSCEKSSWRGLAPSRHCLRCPHRWENKARVQLLPHPDWSKTDTRQPLTLKWESCSGEAPARVTPRQL